MTGQPTAATSVSLGAVQVLRDTIGLQNVDPKDELQMQLAQTVQELGQGATFGQRVVALRFVFAWHLRDAGEVFATSKADYEAHMARLKTRFLAEPKMSVAKAEVMAEADDESYRLKLAYLVAEQRERAMRKFLDALESALDNHRTDRADLRAGDRAHAQGIGGGA